MTDEIIDIYDESLTRIGAMSRDRAHSTGAWHRSIHVWIVRPEDNGYVLFQKRGRDKKLYPNCLDITAAGHYRTGEEAKDGVREVLEELGVEVRLEDLIPLGIKMDVQKVGSIVNREFDDVFLLRRHDNPSEYHLDPSEVEGLVQIAVDHGLKLFSGEADDAPASGIEWDRVTETWHSIEIRVKPNDFIPRTDPYYYKIFIMARALLAGDSYLAI